MPVTRDRASSIVWPGTAITTTSAWEPSPPSFPSAVTSWPARVHSLARPPPTFPRPTTTILIWTPLVLRDSSFASRVVPRIGEHRLSQRPPASHPERATAGHRPQLMPAVYRDGGS